MPFHSSGRADVRLNFPLPLARVSQYGHGVTPAPHLPADLYVEVPFAPDAWQAKCQRIEIEALRRTECIEDRPLIRVRFGCDGSDNAFHARVLAAENGQLLISVAVRAESWNVQRMMALADRSGRPIAGKQEFVVDAARVCFAVQEPERFPEFAAHLAQVEREARQPAAAAEHAHVEEECKSESLTDTMRTLSARAMPDALEPEDEAAAAR